jgi:O-antigen/teichoic acid export membrane protein
VASRRRQIVSASAATLLVQFVRIVGGLLVVPVLLGMLGVERYGFVALIVSLMTVFVLLESVLTPVLRNELVKARAVGSQGRIDESLTVGLSAAAGLLGLSLPVLALLSMVDWSAVLRVPAALPATTAVLVGAFIGVLGASTAFADCLYAAWNELARLRIYEAIATGCGLLAVVVMARVGVALEWVIVAMAAPVPAVRVLAWLLFLKAHRIRPRLSLSVTARFFKAHRGASAAFAGTQALACVASLFPLILLNHTQGLADVSVYTVAQRLIGAPANLVVALFPVFWPQLARAWELGQRGWIAGMLWRGSVALVLGTAAAAAASYAIGPWFVEAWTNGTLAVSASVLGLFALLCGAQVMQGWLSTILNAIGEFRYQFVCYAAFSIGCVVFGAAGLMALGLDGLVLGLTLATSLFGIVPMALRARRRVSRPV